MNTEQTSKNIFMYIIFYNNFLINILTFVNITKFVLISYLEKDHDMIETRRLKNVVIFMQTVLSSVLSIKIKGGCN